MQAMRRRCVHREIILSSRALHVCVSALYLMKSPCVSGKTTLRVGSVSGDACFCPDAQFESSTGVCKPCGTCLPNEYVASPCGGTSDVQCHVCDACASKQDFVPAINLCKGFERTQAQACTPCRLARQCSESSSSDFVTLSRCYSGDISVDTTVCMSRAR